MDIGKLLAPLTPHDIATLLVKIATELRLMPLVTGATEQERALQAKAKLRTAAQIVEIFEYFRELGKERAAEGDRIWRDEERESDAR